MHARSASPCVCRHQAVSAGQQGGHGPGGGAQLRRPAAQGRRVGGQGEPRVLRCACATPCDKRWQACFAPACVVQAQIERSTCPGCSALSPPATHPPADLIAVPQDDMKTAGFQYASGLLLDLSFAAGSMAVDGAKNAMVYGPGGCQGLASCLVGPPARALASVAGWTVCHALGPTAGPIPRMLSALPAADATTLRILHGGIEPPREMQSLYARLNSGGWAGAGRHPAPGQPTCLLFSLCILPSIAYDCFAGQYRQV